MIKEFIKGLKLNFNPYTPLVGGTFILEDGNEISEQITYEYIYKSLSEYDNPILVDVGANSGLYSTINKNSNFKIYSFEPNPLTYLVLRDNVERNNCNSKLYNIALGDKTQKLYLNYEEILWKYGLNYISDEYSPIEVEVKRMDEIIDINEKITHIKIDVEGYEAKVLRGIGKIINHRPEFFLEINDDFLKRSGTSEEDILNFFKEHNYKLKRNIEKNIFHFTPN